MIEKIIIITLFCCGLKKSTEEGMVLSPVKQFLVKHVKIKWILKPVIDCIYCFASFWGTIVYWNIQGGSITEWIIVCIACIFTNGLAYGILAKYENYLS